MKHFKNQQVLFGKEIDEDIAYEAWENAIESLTEERARKLTGQPAPTTSRPGLDGGRT